MESLRTLRDEERKSSNTIVSSRITSTEDAAHNKSVWHTISSTMNVQQSPVSSRASSSEESRSSMVLNSQLCDRLLQTLSSHEVGHADSALQSITGTPPAEEAIMAYNGETISVTEPQQSAGLLNRSYGHSSGNISPHRLVDGDGPPQPIFNSPAAQRTSISNEGTISVEERQSSIRPRSQIRNRSSLYTPFWLRKTMLTGFLLLFTSLWISLLIVYRYATDHNGLTISLTSNHYAWTYGPTAILVVIVSLWRQVDYYCKLVQPWHEMFNGPAPAHRSVLLDYVSPFQLTTFYRASRNRHYSVAASIFGFTLLKLITIVSTALLVSSPTVGSALLPIRYSTTFTAATALDSLLPTTIGRPNADGQTTQTVSAYRFNSTTLNFLWSYLGNINGLPLDPLRIHNDTVMQAFDVDARPANMTTLSSSIEIFLPNVTCEKAEVLSLAPDNDMYVQIGLNSQTCSVGEHQAIIVRQVVISPQEQQYVLHRINCSAVGNSSSVTPGGQNITASTAYDLRWVVMAFELTSTFDKTDNTSYVNTTSLSRATASICKIGYNMKTASATRSLAGNDVLLNIEDPSAKGRLLPDLTQLQLQEMIFGGLLSVATEFNSWPPLFSLMAARDGSEDYNVFFNEHRLLDSSSAVLEACTAQFAQAFLLSASSTNGTGTVKFAETRLHVRLISLWTMFAGFIMLTLLTIFLLLRLRADVVPQAPGSIASHATVLASSKSLANLLRDTGGDRSSALKAKLKGSSFGVIVADQAYCVEVVGRLPELSTTWENAKSKPGIWLPLAGKIPMVGFTFILPLLAITILEILQQCSDKQNGLMTVSASDPDSFDYLRYLSSLSMVLIATLINNLDFAIATFTPFSVLRSASAPADRTFLSQLLGRTPVSGVYQSVRQKNIGAALSILAASIGSVLTIIVSGLWIANVSEMQATATGVSSHTWNTTGYNSSEDDGGAAVRLNTLQHGGSGIAVGSWEDLVFPQINPASFDSKATWATSNSFQLYTFTVPALRPELSCDLVPPENITITSQPSFSNRTSFEMVVEVARPLNCDASGGRNRSTIAFGNSWSAIPGYPEDYTMGMFMEVPLFQWNSSVNVSYAGFGQSYQLPESPAGCPTVGIILGSAKFNSTAKEQLTALICSQKIQRVLTNVTYSSNSSNAYTDSGHLPVILEQPTEYFNNGTDGVETFPYRFASNLADHLMPFKPYVADASIREQYDVFFDHVLAGPDGVDISTLIGPSNAGNLIRAINKLYKKYMMQVIDLKFRQPILLNDPGGRTETQLQGITRQSRRRLYVNKMSKIILQVMLASMMVLTGLAFYLVPIRGTLPRNPCSIASTMGFLAGSRLCDRKSGIIPPGAEFMDRKALEKLFKSRRFSLGWWQTEMEDLGNVPSNGVQAEKNKQETSAIHRENQGEEISESTSMITRELESGVVTSGIGRFGIDVGFPTTRGFRKTSSVGLVRRWKRKRVE